MRLFVLSLVFLVFLLASPDVRAVSDGVYVGVNMYNPYFAPPHYGHENRLAPKTWHNRLPFFARVIGENRVEVRGDTQEIVDAQIQYAAAAGVDYFSFVYWDWQGINPRVSNPNSKDMNHFLRLYLESDYKNLIKFSLTVSATQIDLTKDLGLWDTSFVPNLIRYLKDPQYQKVIGDRPVVYFLHAARLEELFGSREKVTAAIQRIRNRAGENGVSDPYLVAMMSESSEANSLLGLGFDAVSAYTAQTGNTDYNNGALWPYSRLMANNKIWWTTLASGNFENIPTLNLGWDYRPNMPIADYGGSPLFEQPTAAEIISHVRDAIKWVKERRQLIPSQTIYVYSWAEFPEGGWLTPTLDEGEMRVKAFANGLNKSYVSPRGLPPVKPGDLNYDGKVNIFDYQALIANFGNPHTIFDYQKVIANFGK